MPSRLARTRTPPISLRVEELESRALPSVGPLPASHLPPRPDLAQIANLMTELDSAETAMDTNLTRQVRDRKDLAQDHAELAALRTQAALVHAAILADVSATPSQKADDLAEAAWLAGQISHVQADSTIKQHDLTLVNAVLITEHTALGLAETELDQLQTTLFTRPALYRTVALLRSDIVSRDQLQADLDRAHADVNRDLIDLRQDQADAADDDARVHQLQARLGTTVNPATKAHLTTWLRAVQTDMNGDRADLQQDRNEVVAASTTASLFAEQLYQAENAVAAGWRALLMAYISR